MEKENIVNLTIEFVKKTLDGGESGHNWFHIERVLNNAKLIAKKTKESNESIEINFTAVELGALLHDISDYKFNDGDEEAGSRISREFLESQKVDETIIKKVVDIIDAVTFKGPKEKNKANFIEAMIVQDADRLDAIGAIGIARCFAYGGNKNREIYDPNCPPNTNMDWKEYKNNKSSSLNHFYEKLFFLKDMFNTEEGKKLASKRHDYMVEYVNRFEKEWKGEDY